mmetsp:Transcript_20805/g.43850  ORF Transcript_20805/g.43850 Transcript_20805/m.43850 type:complete len:263 (+) Transcript_20805:56-844(+)
MVYTIVAMELVIDKASFVVVATEIGYLPLSLAFAIRIQLTIVRAPFPIVIEHHLAIRTNLAVGKQSSKNARALDRRWRSRRSCPCRRNGRRRSSRRRLRNGQVERVPRHLLRHAQRNLALPRAVHDLVRRLAIRAQCHALALVSPIFVHGELHAAIRVLERSLAVSLTLLPLSNILIAIRPVVCALVALELVVHETSFEVVAAAIGHLALPLALSIGIQFTVVGAPFAMVIKHNLSIRAYLLVGKQSAYQAKILDRRGDVRG